jgi:hypothetical protein
VAQALRPVIDLWSTVACGKTWGGAKDKLCDLRNFMHRNLPPTQEKCLCQRGFSADDLAMARESVGLFDPRLMVHLAVG